MLFRSPAITLPADSKDLSVAADGSISVRQNGGPSSVIGSLELARFVNPAGLTNLGHNLYAETAASGVPSTGTPGSGDFGHVQQGMLEMSNVRVVDEIGEAEVRAFDGFVDLLPEKMQNAWAVCRRATCGPML